MPGRTGLLRTVLPPGAERLAGHAGTGIGKAVAGAKESFMESKAAAGGLRDHGPVPSTEPRTTGDPAMTAPTDITPTDLYCACMPPCGYTSTEGESYPDASAPPDWGAISFGDNQLRIYVPGGHVYLLELSLASVRMGPTYGCNFRYRVDWQSGDEYYGLGWTRNPAMQSDDRNLALS
jgi:hypothetical protein